jgi:hypothetical protein
MLPTAPKRNWPKTKHLRRCLKTAALTGARTSFKVATVDTVREGSPPSSLLRPASLQSSTLESYLFRSTYWSDCLGLDI